MSKGGTNCALKLIKKRRIFRKKLETPFKYKYHMAKGTVLSFAEKEAKQPNSALRKCVVVNLHVLKQKVFAFIPLCGSKGKIKVHDEVTVQSIGGSKGRSKGDIAGVSYQVIKINNICIKQKFLNKK